MEVDDSCDGFTKNSRKKERKIEKETIHITHERGSEVALH